MGLDLRSQNESVAIEHDDEVILGLFEDHGVAATHWMRIRDAFYEDPKITSQGQVRSLLAEITELRGAIVEKLIEKRKVSAKKPDVRKVIEEQIASSDPIICKIDEIVVVLKDAIETTGVIRCDSD